METIAIFLAMIYGLLCFCSFFMAITKDRMSSRILQVMHCFYLLGFGCLFLWWNENIFFVLTVIELVVALFYTYKFVSIDNSESTENWIEHLEPNARQKVTGIQTKVKRPFSNNKSGIENKKFQATVNEVFKNIDTNPQNTQL